MANEHLVALGCEPVTETKMYIEDQGQIGDSKRYAIQLDAIRLESFLNDKGIVIRGEKGNLLNQEDCELLSSMIRDYALSTESRREHKPGH